MTEFLLLVAGSNQRVLMRAPQERVKQAALGGVILTTAGLAVISSTFALHMALHAPIPVALFFGLLWGVAIANLDRWLVTATTRQPTAWKNIKLAIPRLLFALIIGLVVSTPLTLQIFSAEINSELTVMQAETRADFERQLAEDPRYRDLPELRAEMAELEDVLETSVAADAVHDHPEVEDLRERLAAVEEQWLAAERDVVCEREGTCGSQTAGAGPAFAEKVALRDRLQTERADLRAALEATTERVRADVTAAWSSSVEASEARLAELRETVGQMQALRDAESAQASAATESSDGLLARLKALHRIGEGDTTLAMAHLALFLFFTVLECLPVLFKLMLSLGKPSLYEQLMTLEDEAVYKTARRDTEAAQEVVDVQHRTALAAQEARLGNQLQAEVDAAQAVLDAQVALARRAVGIWQARQEELVDRDVESFVTTGPSMTPATQRHGSGAALTVHDSSWFGAGSQPLGEAGPWSGDDGFADAGSQRRGGRAALLSWAKRVPRTTNW
jgi:hypothetical protein